MKTLVIYRTLFSNKCCRDSLQFKNKPINCEQTSFLLTKEKSLIYYELNLIFVLYLTMNLSCISVFRFVQLIRAVKLLSLHPYRCKYFFVKASNARIFSTVNCNKNSCQSLAAPLNLGLAANCKPSARPRI